MFIEKWKKFSQHSKKAHTLATCLECALLCNRHSQGLHFNLFLVLQLAFTHFPKMFHHQSQPVTFCLSYSLVYEATYGTSFTRSLCECKESELLRKPTKVDKRRVKRKLQQESRDHMHEQMRKTDALNVLAEGQSLKSYKRLRFTQSFETPKQKQSRVSNRPVKEQKHSPKFDNVLWNKENVLADLRAWPVGDIINWFEFAREHDIPGENGGQVAKKFAKENRIDVFALDQRPSQNRVKRARKLRMPGQDVSVPTHSTSQKLKKTGTR